MAAYLPPGRHRHPGGVTTDEADTDALALDDVVGQIDQGHQIDRADHPVLFVAVDEALVTDLLRQQPAVAVAAVDLVQHLLPTKIDGFFARRRGRTSIGPECQRHEAPG